jgi:YbbR domain-containing protein
MNFLEDLFKKDSLLARVVSLVVACFLWAYVMMEQNPVIERYYEVPLVQKNIAQNMEVFNAPETVTVQVRASRLLLDDDAGKAINAYVDLKGISEGQQKLHVHATFAKGEVVNILPKDASVFVDHTVEKTVPVVTSVVDNYDEDITVDSNGITPSEAVVRGASSRLSKISKVTAPVSIKDQRGNFQSESVLVPLDDNGKLVSDVHIIPDKATVDAVIVRKMVAAELPVRVVINGELPEGLHIAQMQVLPEKVRVTAPPSVLKNLKEINTKPIDITVLTGSMAINTGLELPDKVIPAVNEVQVRFSVERQ